MKNALFRFFSMLAHRMSAWNTGGEGIHSPRLFYLVRHLFYETSQLYVWQQIEDRRQAMLRAPKLLHIEDLGTGIDRDELVMSIARRSVMKRAYAQLLARMLYYMSGAEYVPNRHRPLVVLELGTSLGITTAYLATASPPNRIYTFEGSASLAQMAAQNWEKLNIHSIQQILGPIDETLYNYVRDARERIDFVLMDANHTMDATLRYFDWLAPQMDQDGVIVVDDIRYTAAMYSAWKTICAHPLVTACMDLGQMGLVFFCPQLQKRTYKVRI